MCTPMMALGGVGLGGKAVSAVGDLIGGKAGRTMEKVGGYMSNPASAIGDAIGGKTGKTVTKLGGKAMNHTMKTAVKF